MSLTPEQLKKQYNIGTTTPVSSQPVQSTQPKKVISPTDIKKQYGISSLASSGSYEEQSAELMAQGQPVATQGRFNRTGKITPGFGGSVVRDIVKPVARLGTNLVQAAQVRKNPDATPFSGKFLGDVKAVGQSGNFGKDILDSVGVGAEVASNFIGGEGAGSVVKAGFKGLVRQGIKQGAKTGTQAGAAYGFGSGLQDQEDKNIGQILGNTAVQTIKGGIIGGLTGGVLGGTVATPGAILGKTAGITSAGVRKTEKELQRIENNYQKLRKNAKFSKDGNEATRKRIAETGVISTATDKTGTINTDEAVKRYKVLSGIDKSEGVVRKNLERLGETVDLNTVEKKLLDTIRKSKLEGAELKTALNSVKKEIAGYRLRATPEGKIPLTLVHDAKIASTSSINFSTAPEIKLYKKTLARGLKELVEEQSSFNVKEVNDTLAPYLQDITYLENLNGRKVKGGKLGKYSARIAGNIAGGIAGGSVGGLPGSAFGTIVGGEVGDAIQGRILKSTFGRNAEKALPESKILKRAVQTGNSPRPQLPAPKAGQPRVQQVSGKTINLPKRTQSAVDAQSLANLKAQKIAPPSKIPSKISISKSVASKKLPSKPSVGSKIKSALKDQRGFIATGFKNEGNLTTKILKDLEGKTTVSKQYILDATNRGELKQVERDITRQVLEDMTRGSDNPLVQYAKKFKSADEFAKNIYGSATQYGEYTPQFRHLGMEDYKNISKLGVKPDEMVTIYRGIDDTTGKIPRKINEGDFVTTDFDSAASYSGADKVISMEVPAKTLYTDAIDDFKADPFYTGSEYVYTKQKVSPMTKSELVDTWNQAQKSDTINVKEFADRVKSELLPLKTSKQINPRYEHISLPSELRGNVKNYAENVYESPIKTSAGDVHFPSYSSSSRRAGTDEAKNYFGHTRIEDMADNQTRRVIEVQSDLHQKGNMQREFDTLTSDLHAKVVQPDILNKIKKLHPEITAKDVGDYIKNCL